MLDLSKLRKALSLADDVPETEVLTKAEEKFTADATALTTAQASVTTLTQERDAAKAQALTLSQATPRTVDKEILSDRLGTFSDKLDVLMEKNKCTPQQKEAALAIVAPGGQPGLMLSQSISTGPASSILKLLELQNTNPFGQQSGAQPVPRAVPGAGDGVDALAEGRAQGDAYQKAALQSRGLTAAV